MDKTSYPLFFGFIAIHRFTCLFTIVFDWSSSVVFSFLKTRTFQLGPMAIATSSATLALTSGVKSNKSNVNLGGKASSVYLPRMQINQKGRRNLAVCARRDSSGGGQFLTGFVLGGAIIGALTYYYAPQIRRAVERENEHGFKIPKIENFSSDVYFYDDEDEGLEKTRDTLNSKIKQLNTAIDNVSTRLKDNVAARFKSVTSKTPPPPPRKTIIDDGDMKYGV